MTYEINRRRFITASLAASLAASSAGFALATENFPSRTITFVCAFSAGGGADVIVRFLADKIGSNTGHTVVVENRPGAAGNIAAEHVARSRPDGHTVFIHSGVATAANMSLFRDPPINPAEDLRGVSFVSKHSMTVIVSIDSPVETMDELIEHVRSKGADASYGVNNTGGRVVGALIKKDANLDVVEINYGGSADSTNDLTGGLLDFVILDPVSAMSAERNGRVRILGVSQSERLKSAPDYPTLGESSLNVAYNNWWGAFVAADTPSEIVDKLNGFFEEALMMPETVEFLAISGADPYLGAPDEVQAAMEAEIDIQREFIELAGIPQN